jgi:transposase
MTKAFPLEFHRDVIAVARSSDAPMSQVVRDFVLTESCLQRWLKMDEIEEGCSLGVSQAESARLRDVNRRIRMLEQGNQVLRQAVV